MADLWIRGRKKQTVNNNLLQSVSQYDGRLWRFPSDDVCQRNSFPSAGAIFDEILVTLYESETLRVLQHEIYKNGAFKHPWFHKSIYYRHEFCPALLRPVHFPFYFCVKLEVSDGYWQRKTRTPKCLKMRQLRKPFLLSSVNVSIKKNHPISLSQVSKNKNKQQLKEIRSIFVVWMVTHECFTPTWELECHFVCVILLMRGLT